jgi:hypothetical protein
MLEQDAKISVTGRSKRNGFTRQKRFLRRTVWDEMHVCEESIPVATFLPVTNGGLNVQRQ